MTAGEKYIKVLHDIRAHGDFARDKKGKLLENELGEHYRVATPEQKKKLARFAKEQEREVEESHRRVEAMARGILGDDAYETLKKKTDGMDPDVLLKSLFQKKLN